jgi:hypothetical protein
MAMPIQDDINAAQAEAARLSGLLELYPDLRQETDRWRRVFSCSTSVNTIATHYEIAYSCGCCPDASLYIRLFVETPYGKVYGVPHQIGVGERRSWEYFDCPDKDWEKTLKARGAPDHILEKLRAHFADEERLKQEAIANDE